MHDRGDRGFTLIELLVVVGIIVIATAMAMPAINQFLKGQKLAQAGRLIQSAFNEARRAAITQRARHWIFFGRVSGNGLNPDVYQLAHYREGKGWDSTQVLKLPSTIQPIFTTADGEPTASGPWIIKGCQLPVQDWTEGLPLNAAPTVLPGAQAFMDPTSLTVANGCTTFEFRKDGTILQKGMAQDIAPAMAPGGQTDIYDVNAVFDALNVNTPADIVLKQIGEPEKRCFIDVDLNTGRVRFRVAQINGTPGTTSGP